MLLTTHWLANEKLQRLKAAKRSFPELHGGWVWHFFPSSLLSDLPLQSRNLARCKPGSRKSHNCRAHLELSVSDHLDASIKACGLLQCVTLANHDGGGHLGWSPWCSHSGSHQATHTQRARGAFRRCKQYLQQTCSCPQRIDHLQVCRDLVAPFPAPHHRCRALCRLCWLSFEGVHRHSNVHPRSRSDCLAHQIGGSWSTIPFFGGALWWCCRYARQPLVE